MSKPVTILSPPHVPSDHDPLSSPEYFDDEYKQEEYNETEDYPHLPDTQLFPNEYSSSNISKLENPFADITTTQNTSLNSNFNSEFNINDQLSNEDLISQTESQMLQYEQKADYLKAEKCRLTLEKLKRQQKTQTQSQLKELQNEDIRIFYTMIQQHQSQFDQIWTQKTLEHKLRADELIESLKQRHDIQQRELYEQLRQRRLPRFSVELLNMRKRQVLLAKSKNYIAAEKLKRKCDLLEQLEIERIRSEALLENQQRFSQLLIKQENERQSLANKLKIEKKCLIEAKTQEFERLKKRLKNAEQELKRTHIRQQILAEKKLTSLKNQNSPKRIERGNSLRNTAKRAIEIENNSNQSQAIINQSNPLVHRSAREIAAMGKPGNFDYNS